MKTHPDDLALAAYIAHETTNARSDTEWKAAYKAAIHAIRLTTIGAMTLANRLLTDGTNPFEQSKISEIMFRRKHLAGLADKKQPSGAQADLIERLECYDWRCPNADKLAVDAANVLKELTAENERLRDALGLIANGDHDDYRHSRLDMMRIASAALSTQTRAEGRE